MLFHNELAEKPFGLSRHFLVSLALINFPSVFTQLQFEEFSGVYHRWLYIGLALELSFDRIFLCFHLEWILSLAVFGGSKNWAWFHFPLRRDFWSRITNCLIFYLLKPLNVNVFDGTIGRPECSIQWTISF